MNFYYDTSKLKREWSKDNLSNFADFLSEVMRSDYYYKDGWSNGFVEDFDDDILHDSLGTPRAVSLFQW